MDYKTGSKEFRLSDILYGHNLQMFLYLLMLQKGDRAQVRKQLHAGAAEAIEPCGALYIPAKNPAVSAEAGDTPEKLRQAREAERRRIGLVLDDDELIEAMERGGTYRFLPIKRKNDGSFTKASKVASPEQIKLLLFKTEAMLRKIALDISSGEIEAEPIRTGDAGEEKGAVCRYCAFQDACQFDPSMKKDHYRVPISCSNERVFEILAEEAKGENAQ